MELRNLGNFIIAEPLFNELRKTFPQAEIRTSLQMSAAFNRKHFITQVTEPRFWTYGKKTIISSAFDVIRLLLWKLTKIKIFLNSPMLKELYKADLVIDFSGDIYGDNANWVAFLESNIRLTFSLALKRRTAMVAGSPGPFSSTWRQRIAKKVLPKLDLLTNREPISTAILEEAGIKCPNVHTRPCPSVLFKACDFESIPKNDDYYRLNSNDSPIIGLILCGWNMPCSPYSKWPREDWEYENFIALIEYLFKNTSSRICLMSHQNATTQNGEPSKGNDHRIIEHLMKLCSHIHDRERLFTLTGLYTAAQSKAIISKFEVLMSGRIHGAVQGLSQSVPTAIINYGHEPIAHKLKGFAKIYKTEEYILDPSNKTNLISGAQNLINKKDQIHRLLKLHLATIKEQSIDTFRLIKEITLRDL